MCGIVGFLGGQAHDVTSAEILLRRMADRIAHRGPDDAGYWFDPERRIGLGHRRLSIVDLSSAGHQPMESAGKRYVISFNGEIYNHLDLRESLGKGVTWRGHSDTETLLAGFDAWGIQGAVERAVGMFAIAVWDRQSETLTLARDRMGEKSMYYGWQGRGSDAVFLFGSELKALRAHQAFENKIDRRALSLQLRHNAIPAPYSIYEGIAKVLPGSLVTISLRQREPQMVAYWSGAQMAEHGATHLFAGSADQAVDELEVLLKDAVRRQMMSDVPLGAFLSGGVDSSTVVALMQAQGSRPVKTFTIGFHEAGQNEAEHAKAVAKHLGTEHTELYVTAQEAMAVIPRLPQIYDEPFSDSSQIPTFLVSQLARSHVTVSLSGDGGDELFCGYNRYQATANIWRRIERMPLGGRKLLAGMLLAIPPRVWNAVGMAGKRLSGATASGSSLGDKVHKGATVMTSSSSSDLYRQLTSHWRDPGSVVIDGSEPATLLEGNAPALNGLDDVQRMMALDMLTYLPDDILVKVDRAAMAVSLETRVPLLDHRVAEFAWKLPQSLKLRDGQTKWALRQVLYRHVPKQLIERPKMGFAVPIGEWLRGPLRDWAEALLDEPRLRREGYFNPGPVRAKWQQHLSGRRNWEHQLWDVLMFQLWLEAQ